MLLLHCQRNSGGIRTAFIAADWSGTDGSGMSLWDLGRLTFRGRMRRIGQVLRSRAGCGMTRAVCYILTGRFTRGIQLNPAAPLWILFLGWFFANRYLRGVYSKHTTLWLGVVCAVTLAVYLYRMINCFPGEPPMVYYRNNILRRSLEDM